ncbi:hypothetical protein [Paraconexibacter sp.]|uniref:hypothetical protein n=1 Tax=Paraconexibacter sp. TaxID=2949640 RepID=UPI0035696709
MPRAVRALLLSVLLSAVCTPVAATAKVPREFFGVMIDGPATETPGVLEREAPRMRARGPRTVRFAIDWAAAQPYASFDQVPEGERERFTDVGGVPTDFSRSDRIVRLLAAGRLRPFPVILHAPDWAAKFPGPFYQAGRYGSPPASPRTYARFVAALARRYGPSGTLWRSITPSKRRPIRDWQIWNEPNLGQYWSEKNFQRGYVPLLRASRKAIRAVDRKARIVTGGLTNGASSTAWTALRRIYEAGGKGTFDVVALHPYTRNANGVRATIRSTRKVTRDKGQGRMPILLSEISFSSSDGESPDRKTFATWDTSEGGQADRLRSTLKMVVRERRRLRISGVLWYTWLSPDVQKGRWSDYAGLSRLDGHRIVRKPALLSFQRTVRQLSR